MEKNKIEPKKKDKFEEVIEHLEEYEKDTPKIHGKHAYDLCRCGVEHGDERDHDPKHNYHMSEYLDEENTKDDDRKGFHVHKHEDTVNESKIAKRNRKK